MVCTVDAISFKPMYDNSQRNITIIGSCDKNPINYRVAFVFSRHGAQYTLDEDLYLRLYGKIALTITDVKAYIKSPQKYCKVLEKRFDWKK